MFTIIYHNRFLHFLQILMEFEMANSSAIASAFLDTWPRLESQLRGALVNHYKKKDVCTGWSLEIENVLI